MQVDEVCCSKSIQPNQPVLYVLASEKSETMKPQKPIDKRPKCRTCKDRFVPLNNNLNQKHCIEKDECVAAHVEHSKQLREKANRQQKAIAKVKDQKVRNEVYSGKYKNELAKACQMLARMIDHRFNFPCIDCEKSYGNQVDGGHFNSKGSNITIAYNLHNIHSQKSDCNQNGLGGGRRLEYYRGLVKRYGQWYADYVDTGLQNEYKLIKLSPQEVFEKLTLVRALIRTFDTFQFTDGIAAREQMNALIGIYKKSVYSYRETIKQNDL